MKVAITNYSLFEFAEDVGFWGSAESVWKGLTSEQRHILDDIVADYTFYSLAEINDFVWFDAEDILADYADEEDDKE